MGATIYRTGLQHKAETLAEYPVVFITGLTAMAFAQWFSKMTGTNCRLPTPEEWRCAARADRQDWYDQEISKTNYKDTTNKLRPVRETLANPYGIRDLLGNVWDLCVTENSTGQSFTLLGGCYSSTKDNLNEKREICSVKEICTREVVFVW